MSARYSSESSLEHIADTLGDMHDDMSSEWINEVSNIANANYGTRDALKCINTNLDKLNGILHEILEVLKCNKTV